MTRTVAPARSSFGRAFKARRILGRPKNEQPYLLIPAGFRAADAIVPSIVKKPLDQIPLAPEHRVPDGIGVLARLLTTGACLVASALLHAAAQPSQTVDRLAEFSAGIPPSWVHHSFSGVRTSVENGALASPRRSVAWRSSSHLR